MALRTNAAHKNPMTHVADAMHHQTLAFKAAQRAWAAYAEQEDEKNPPTGKYAHGMRQANQAQAATHLSDDVRVILGIDRYGVQTR
jgi:hypothetical protein